MSNHLRRSRGRPKGTGKKDLPVLTKVADMLTADPALKPTTAMKRCGVKTQADLRRHQRKWKEQGPALLAARKQATDTPRPMPDSRPPAGPYGHVFATQVVLAQIEETRRRIEGPLTQLARQRDVFEQTIDAMTKAMSPVERYMRMVHDALGPVEELRRLQEMADPLPRIAKAAQDHMRTLAQLADPIEELRRTWWKLGPFGPAGY